MRPKLELVIFCAHAETAADWAYTLRINTGRRWLRYNARTVTDVAALQAEVGRGDARAVLLLVETERQGAEMAARLPWDGRSVVALGWTPGAVLGRRLHGSAASGLARRMAAGPVFATAWQRADVIDCLVWSIARKRGPKPRAAAQAVCAAMATGVRAGAAA